jgi:hypothetical protein
MRARNQERTASRICSQHATSHGFEVVSYDARGFEVVTYGENTFVGATKVFCP